MKKLSKWLSLVLGTTVFLSLTSFAINVCDEYGPHFTDFVCTSVGTLKTAGTLNYVETTVCSGQSLPPLNFTTCPTFYNGNKRTHVTYDCTPGQNGDLNVPVFYTYKAGDLYLNPTPPASYTDTVDHDYTYAVKVRGTPSPLAGWWKGQDNGTDAIFGNTMQLYGVGVSYDDGKVGRCFKMNMATSGDWPVNHAWMRVNATPALNVGPGPGMTVELWTKFKIATGNEPIFEWNNNTSIGAHMWKIQKTTGTSGTLVANLIDVQGNFHFVETGPGVVIPGVFQHLALTYDRTTGHGKIYCNGVKVADTDVGIFVPQTSYNLDFGIRSSDTLTPSSAAFSGWIDEPAVYGCALTDEQILQIYQAGSAGKPLNACAGAGCSPVITGCVCSPTADIITSASVIVHVIASPAPITLPGGDFSFFKDTGPAVIDSGANYSGTWSGAGTLTVGFSPSTAAPGDRLSVMHVGTGTGQIGVSGTTTKTITFGTTTIGTFTPVDGNPLEITLTSGTTDAALDALLKNITYELNLTPACRPATPRNLEWTLRSQATSCTSAPAFKPVNIVCPPVDVMIVFDKSSSMGPPYSDTRYINARNAAISFVGLLKLEVPPNNDRAGLVTFCAVNESHRDVDLTTDESALTSKLCNIGQNSCPGTDIQLCGGTAIGTGVILAREHLLATATTGKRVMVVLTDGDNTAGPSPVPEAQTAKNNGIRIITIGIELPAPPPNPANDTARNTLRDMATTPSDFYEASDSATLNTIYQQIAASLCVEPNQAPRITFGHPSQTYTENNNNTAVQVDSSFTFTDTEDFKGGTLTFNFTSATHTDDRLEIGNIGGVTVSGTDISLGGHVVGTIAGGSGANALVITLDPVWGTASAGQAIGRALTFRNLSDNPPASIATRTLQAIANDGDGGCNSGASAATTITVNVIPANDPPSIAFSPATLNYAENDAATPVAPSSTVTDIDSPNFEGAVMTLTFTAGGLNEDRLSVRNQGTGAGQVGVPNPNAMNKDITYNFGSGAVPVGTFWGGIGTIQPLSITFYETATLEAVQAVMRNITYWNASENPSTSQRTLRAITTDGDGGTSGQTTMTINVAAINDAPTIQLSPTPLAYTENALATLLAPASTVSDPDSANMDTGYLKISFQSGGGTGDRLGIRYEGTGVGQVSTAGNAVRYNPGSGTVTIGTFAGGSDGNYLQVTFNSTVATVAAVQAVMKNLTYYSLSENPTVTKVVKGELNDGDGATSPPTTMTINVTRVNDPPVLAFMSMPPYDTVNYYENDYPVWIGGDFSVDDVDSPNFDQGQIIINYNGGNGLAQDQMSVIQDDPIMVDGHDISYWWYTPVGTIDSVNDGSNGKPLVITLLPACDDAMAQLILNRVIYWNTSETPSGAQRQMKVTVSDGDSGTSAQKTIHLNVIPQNDPMTVDLGQPATYGLGDPPLIFAPNAIIQDIEPIDWDSWILNGTIVRVRITGNGETDDVLDVQNTQFDDEDNAPCSIWVSENGVIQFDSEGMGEIIQEGNGTDPMIIQLSDASYRGLRALLRSLSYHSVAQSPSLADRTIEVTVQEAGMPVNQPATKIVHLVVRPLIANAGPDQTITVPAMAHLTGTSTGGMPPMGIPFWSKVSGPGPVNFSPNQSVADCYASFTVPGFYQLQFSVTDNNGEGNTSTDVMQVHVLANKGPVVNAGPDRRIAPGTSATLSGSVTDDGVTSGALTLSWSVPRKPAGAAEPTFTRTVASTSVTLTTPGLYTFKLTATDTGSVSDSDEMTVTVVDLSSRTFTRNVDFEQGSLLNVNYDTIPNELELNSKITPYPYVNIACSLRGTVARIDVNNGRVVGEYRTASMNGDPSRTTVDLYGNVWVANRNDVGPGGSGSVARIGLIIGGTRGRKIPDDGSTTFAFVPDPDGNYLAPPYIYNTCKDKDGDHLIRTSKGAGHILAWNADEAVDLYQVGGSGVRTVAIGKDNNVWTGGAGNHGKLDVVTGTWTHKFTVGGSYGGLIDRNGILWSVLGPVNWITRYNTITDTGVPSQVPAGAYGVGIDPQTGNIWYAGAQWAAVLNPSGVKLADYTHGGASGRGVAVDGSGNVWIATSQGTVAHLRTDGTVVGKVELPCGQESRGVAIDSNGKTWVADANGKAYRVSPDGGPIGGGGFKVGYVDMIVDLNADYEKNQPPHNVLSGPYNYSDMTGFVSLGSTSPSGSWAVIHDGTQNGLAWWANWTAVVNASKGAVLRVEARADNTVAGLAEKKFVLAQDGSGNPLSHLPDSGPDAVLGRYIEVRVTFLRGQEPDGTPISPVLRDLTVAPDDELVIAENPHTIAGDDTFEVSENAGEDPEYTLDVLANDQISTGAALAIPANGLKSAHNGTLKLAVESGKQVVKYIPNKGFFGIDRFIYTVVDSAGAIDHGLAVIRVLRNNPRILPPNTKDDDVVVYGRIDGPPVPKIIAVTENDTAFQLVQPDKDGDGVPDYLDGSPLSNVDSDNDGLPDEWEGWIVSYDPNDAVTDLSQVSPEGDFDGDGRSNITEFHDGTLPFSEADSDGDKVPNYIEQLIGTASNPPGDTDGDGLPNDWETWVLYVAATDGDPANDNLTAVLPGDDFDGDGVSNGAEFTQGTSPISPVKRPDKLSIVNVSVPRHGTVALVNSDGGGAGSCAPAIAYTPEPGFFDVDEFTYTVVNSKGLSDTATVRVTVRPPQTISSCTSPGNSFAGTLQSGDALTIYERDSGWGMRTHAGYVDAYEFSIDAPRRVIITMAPDGGDLETYFYVKNEVGDVVGEGASTLNISLSEPGTYTIEASSLSPPGDAHGTGNYLLEFKCAADMGLYISSVEVPNDGPSLHLGHFPAGGSTEYFTLGIENRGAMPMKIVDARVVFPNTSTLNSDYVVSATAGGSINYPIIIPPGGLDDSTLQLEFTPPGSSTFDNAMVILEYDDDDNLGNGTVTFQARVDARVFDFGEIVMTSPEHNSTFTSCTDIPLAARGEGSSVLRVEFLESPGGVENVIGVASSSGSDHYLTWQSAPAGDHFVRARLVFDTDPETYMNSSSVLIKVRDSVQMTGPVGSAPITPGNNITLQATASTGSPRAVIDHVDFYDVTSGSEVHIGLATLSGGVYSRVWNSVPMGVYQVIAKATVRRVSDNFTWESPSSNQLELKVVPINTTVALVSPPNGAVLPPPANYTLVAEVTHSAELTVKSVTFDGSPISPGTGTVLNQYPLNWLNPPAGKHQITARMEGTSLDVISDPVTVFVGSSVVVLDHEAQYAAGSSFNLRARVDLGATDVPTKVEFYNVAVPGTPLGSVNISAGGDHSWQWSSVPAGKYQIKARLFLTGGAQIDSDPATIFVRNAVTLQLSVVDQKKVFAAPGSIPFNAEALALDGYTVQKVQFIDVDANQQIGADDTTYPYGLTWSGVASGRHVVRAKGYFTKAGQPTDIVTSDDFVVYVAGGNFVQITAPAAIPPTVLRYEVGEPVPLIALAIPSQGKSISTVTFRDNGSSIGEGGGSETRFSFRLSNVPEGDHTYTATAVMRLKSNPDFTWTIKSPAHLIHVRVPSIPNDPPVAVDDTYTLWGKTSSQELKVTINDTDPEGDPFTVVWVPSLTPRGIVSISEDGKSLIYRPRIYAFASAMSLLNIIWPSPGTDPCTCLEEPEVAGMFGIDSFNYIIEDNKGGRSRALVKVNVTYEAPSTVTINQVNGGPTPAVNDQEIPATVADIPVVINSTPMTGRTIALMELFADGEKVGEALNPTASQTLTWSLVPSGTHYLQARATDSAGDIAYSATLRVIKLKKAGANALPVAEITSPATTLRPPPTGEDGWPDPAAQYQLQVVEARVTPQGRASDPDDAPTADVVTYQFFLYSATGEPLGSVSPKITREIASGSFLDGAGNPLVLDLTRFQEGVYELELRVSDGWDVTIDTVQFVLHNQLQIGQYTFSQEDLSVGSSGLPLKVTRFYDSYNQKSADFGYGWTYAVNTMDVELYEARTDMEDWFADDEVFSLRLGGGRNVTLTLPDGRRTTFTYRMEGPFDYDSSVQQYLGVWDPEPGVTATLTTLNPGIPIDSLGDNSILASLAGVKWVGTDWRSPREAYDFPGFKLTTEDGTIYKITRGNGEVHGALTREGKEFYPRTYGKPKLTEIIDRDGSIITIGDDKIIRRTPPTTAQPDGVEVNAVVFDRDVHNRIKAIYDPLSLDASGNKIGPATVEYFYDSKGNLEQAVRLVNRQTGAKETTTFVYDIAEFPHYLHRILDPRGIEISRTEHYDASDPENKGKMKSIKDAKGNLTTFVHKRNPADFATGRPAGYGVPVAREEMTFTPAVGGGSRTTVHEADERGNVIYSRDALGFVTWSKYGPRGGLSANDPQANAWLLLEYRYKAMERKGGVPVERTYLGTRTYEGPTSLETPAAQKLAKTAETLPYVILPVEDATPENQRRTTRYEYNILGQVTKTFEPNHSAGNTIYKETAYDVDRNNPTYGRELGQYFHGTDPAPAPGNETTGQPLSRSFYITDANSPFKGLLWYSLDAANVATVNEYYGSGEQEQGGWLRDLKSVTVRAAGPTGAPVSKTVFTYDAVGNRLTEERCQFARDGSGNIAVDGTGNPVEKMKDIGGGQMVPDRFVSRFEYDAKGRVIKATDASLATSETAYEFSGKESVTTDRYNATTTRRYDRTGKLSEIILADGTVIRQAIAYASDPVLGLLRCEVTEDAHNLNDSGPFNGTRTVHNSVDRVICSERIKNLTITVARFGDICDTEYAFDPTQTSDIVASTLTEYYADGQISKKVLDVDRNGTISSGDLVTEYEYAGCNCGSQQKVIRPPTVVDPLDGAMIRSEIVENYDLTGNLTDTQTKSYRTPVGSPEELMAHQPVRRFLYDQLNRQTEIRSCKDQSVPAGNGDLVKRSRYDWSGRPWLEINGDNQAKAQVYNIAGKLTWVVMDVNPGLTELPNGVPNTWLAGTRGLDSTITGYQYDELNRLTAQVDGRNYKALLSYDALGRRIELYLPSHTSGSPMVERWYYDYEEFGDAPPTGKRMNKVRHVDFKNQQTFTTFDALGRLDTKKSSTAVLVDYDYSASGQRSRMRDNLDTTTPRQTRYVYDELNRLRIKDAPEGTLTYEYHPAGKLKTISARTSYTFPSAAPYNFAAINATAVESTPSGAYMAYTYDYRNRLTQVYPDSGPGTLADVKYSYNSVGSQAAMRYQNGVETSYTYDSQNHLRRMRTVNSSGLIANFDYDETGLNATPNTTTFTWGARRLSTSGRRNRVDELVNGTTRRVDYDYDNLNRLGAEKLISGPNTGTINYDSSAGYGDAGYDQVGNRTRRTTALTPEIVGAFSYPNGTVNYSAYDANDRLGPIQTGTVGATFDANGNTTQVDLDGNGTPDLAASDVYDLENRLITAVRSGETISMVYDGDGNRISKAIRVGTTVTAVVNYIVDERNLTGYAQVVEERNATGSTLVSYVYGLDLVSQKRGTTTHYYGYDSLGTVRYLTESSTGNITDTYMYDAFGIAIGGSGTTANLYRFSGEQWDPHLGMYYLRARYYKPELGRFWTMDPFEGFMSDPLSLHKYLYVEDNPTNLTDPSGMNHTVVVQLGKLVMILRLVSMIMPVVVGLVIGVAIACTAFAVLSLVIPMSGPCTISRNKGSNVDCRFIASTLGLCLYRCSGPLGDYIGAIPKLPGVPCPKSATHDEVDPMPGRDYPGFPGE